jgi:hypothetical protein
MALFYSVWKKFFRKFKVVRTPGQKIKKKKGLPPWPEDKIMVLQ